MAKYDAIAVLGTMRSGSNLLERLLSEHPKIVAQSELFNANFIGRAGRSDFDRFTLEERDENPTALLDYVMQKYDDKIPVFRYFHDHDPRALNAILDNPRIAKIILKRNPVDSYISLEIARETKSWLISRRRPHTVNPDVRIEFDIEKYQEWAGRSEKFFETVTQSLDNSGQAYFELRYEDIKNLDVLAEISDFLEIESEFHYIFEPVTRQNPRPRESYLSNPEILGTFNAPDWPAPRTQKTEPKSIVPFGNLARNLNLIYLPLAGNGEEAEIRVLSEANGEPLEKIEASKVDKALKEDPNLNAYTRIINPRLRAYTIFMRHIFGEENGFDRPFLEMAQSWGWPLKGIPQEKTKEALAAQGMPADKIKKYYREFVINVRKELWSGFREHLISQAYWPQTMLIKNLEAQFPLLVVQDQGFPNSPEFAALASSLIVEDEYLSAPADGKKLTKNHADQQIFDLYHEDFNAFGYEIDLGEKVERQI